ESRASAYLCSSCARKETIKSLAFTSLLGWLAIPSWFFYGWRSTYINWRSVWKPPAQLADWGAIPIEGLAYEIRSSRQSNSEPSFTEEEFEDSPLRWLSDSELKLVLAADGLYELLDVMPTATDDEIRRAYRSKAKQFHPDLHSGDPGTAEDMLRL